MAGSTPRTVAVVGAGMVGLATAWFLQEHDVTVTVIDRADVAAGASWGNAGWLTPAIATPLPEPAVLAYGIRAVLTPNSPLYVKPAPDLQLARFVAGFTRHSTPDRWRRAMQALIPVNNRSLEAFDHLTSNGVAAQTHEATQFIAGYSDVAQVKTMLDEFKQIEAAGGHVEHELIGGDEARRREPAISDGVEAALMIRGQRFLNPVTFVHALADAVRERGGQIITDATVTDVQDRGNSVRVETTGGGGGTYDAVVVATGAWLGDLVRQYGVHMVVQAGRGYSFSVQTEHMPSGPIYFPESRVAITPLGDRLRVAGMMEFRRPDEALDPRRISAIVESTRPMLRGADLDDRSEEWVGSRPCTPDGLPLVGRTDSGRVFVAGGHGMWGITLGPITAELLADQIVTGTVPSELTPFDPRRKLSWAPHQLRRD